MKSNAPVRDSYGLTTYRRELAFGEESRLQKLWLAVQRSEWQSLSILPAGPAVDTMAIAEVLAQLSWRYTGRPSGVCDLRDLGMRLVDYQMREVRSIVDGGTRLFVALRSIFENPTAMPIARGTDAVVLCVALGQTELKAAKETISEVGRDRVLGSIIVRKRAGRTEAVVPAAPRR